MKLSQFWPVVAVGALAGGVWWWWRQPEEKQFFGGREAALITPAGESLTEKTLPSLVEKVSLKTGEGKVEGEATREFREGVFKHSLTANLPVLEKGFYQGWLVKGEEWLPTGELREEKGGWLLFYQIQADYRDYLKIAVTKEEKNDGLPEKTVLTGQFAERR